ncbi:hypothetical protein C7B61_16175 [filamentous cyanobacterium CCP1]|nr:hypothetical protein C7B76_01105 [filamentous cyanobacterium CCP2]PSB61274.1 hypothetical protein C7B61_16175 [filamentous cyanobacterium CCP1]
MEVDQIEELLKKIQQLQSIMIAVSTGEEQIQEVEEAYTELYQETDLDIELLHEEGLFISNPNSFTSLWDWYNYWSSNLGNYASRRRYIYNLYVDIINSLERALQDQFVQNISNSSNDILEPKQLEHLLNNIQELQSIMVNVATGFTSIQAEEASYIELYQDISSYIYRLQQLGLQAEHPNHFSSLWYWHGHWKTELGNYASRRQFVGELYNSFVTPIQKALRKHQRMSTSIEQFAEDLRSRFNKQISEQPQVPSTASIESIEQNKNTKTDGLLAGSRQVVEPDYTRHVAAAIPTKPIIDFAIVTAIKTERLAVLNAFEIDVKQDRERKDSRTYWRKRLLLQDGKFYEIVVAQSLDMANVNAAILANDMLHHWKPAAVLMVGIAAAAKPEPKQRIGNLVVGKEVYYYGTSKVTVNGELPEPKYVPVDPTLLDRVQALPSSDFSILVDHPDSNGIRPEIEIGVIASGDKVIADAAERDAIASANRKIMAIEMEGYGVIEAARQSFDQVRCLVIRALCDYADSNKNDQWHAYAASVAAGFTKYFLLDEPLIPRNPPSNGIK